MIDSIKHSAVLSQCHSHCLLIHGERNCLIKVSSTLSWCVCAFVLCLRVCMDTWVGHSRHKHTGLVSYSGSWDLCSVCCRGSYLRSQDSGWVNNSDKGGIGAAQLAGEGGRRQSNTVCTFPHIHEDKNAKSARLPFVLDEKGLICWPKHSGIVGGEIQAGSVKGKAQTNELWPKIVVAWHSIIIAEKYNMHVIILSIKDFLKVPCESKTSIATKQRFEPIFPFCVSCMET